MDSNSPNFNCDTINFRISLDAICGDIVGMSGAMAGPGDGLGALVGWRAYSGYPGGGCGKWAVKCGSAAATAIG